MERRNALKLMISSMIAPAYIANGLMRVKPIIVEDLSGQAIRIMQGATPFINLYPLGIASLMKDIQDEVNSITFDYIEKMVLFGYPPRNINTIGTIVVPEHIKNKVNNFISLDNPITST